MNIYRFVPDGQRYRAMRCSYRGQFWPEGIVVDRLAALTFDRDDDWWLAGNRYHSRTRTRPLADVVATTANLIVLRGRALPLADDLRVAIVTVDNEPAVALQLPLSDAFDLAASSAVRSPSGRPLFWNRIAFRDVDLPDAFWLDDKNPLPFAFVTQRFVDRGRELGVTGLDELELVWNGAPVALSYPPSTEELDRATTRYQLEHGFIEARARVLGEFSEDINPIIENALANGQLPVSYRQG